MIRVLVVPVIDPMRVEEIDGSLESLQRLLDGGYLRAVPGVQNAMALCDDDGLMKGLLYNEHGTSLARALGWVPLPGDHLVGSVVFTGPADEDGETTSVTDYVLGITGMG